MENCRFNTVKGRTCLHEAVSKGNWEHVKLLLQYRVNVNAEDAEGVTPLYEAARSNNVRLIQLLLENGADPNCKTKVQNGKYSTAFHRVLVFGCEESANLFLHHGVDVNLKNYYNNTALHLAVVYFNKEFVEKLLEMGAKINEVSEMGETVLHRLLRCSLRDEAALQKMCLLIKYGVAINATDSLNRTALYNAIVSNQRFEVIDYLINLGVDVSKPSMSVPIAAAVIYGEMRIIKYISSNMSKVSLNNEEEKSLLHTIIENFRNQQQRLQMVEVLIKNGADVNYARISDRKTPLHLSIQEHDLTLFKYLLRCRASVNKQYAEQESLLCMAVQSNFYIAASILIKIGLSISRRTLDRKDLLTVAIENDSTAMMKLLLDNGAVISAQAYQTAVTNNSTHMLKLLLARSVNSSSRASFVNKNLIRAIKIHRPQVVKVLLDNGADVNLRQKTSKRLPLEIAIRTAQYGFFDNESGQRIYCSNDITRLLIRYITLHKFLKMRVDQKNIQLILSRGETTIYFTCCQAELEFMRKTEVCDGYRTTYFDILTKSERALAKRVNKDVSVEFDASNYRLLFPFYSDDLHYKFLLGAERRRLVDDFCDIMYYLLRGEIPIELIYQISDYLNNDELKSCLFVLESLLV